MTTSEHRRPCASRRLAPIVGLLLLLAPLSCSDDGDGETTGDGTAGPTMSVSEAAEAADGTEVTVIGFLLRDGDQPLILSELLAESYPPQAGGATIEVADRTIAELAEAAGMTPDQAGSVEWLNLPITLTGTVEGGRLTGATWADG